MQSRNRNSEDADHLPTPRKARSALLDNRSVILASNRGPVDYALVDGALVPRRGAGGVVSALAALTEHTDVTWISAAMSRGDRLAALDAGLPRPPFLPPTLSHRYVVVDEEAFRLHYNQFSNPLLWYIHHYLFDTAYGPHIDDDVRSAWQDGYLPVNRAFAHALAPLAVARSGEKRPFVMLHDYQLYLVPSYLRMRVSDALLSLFVHIPWPASGYWQLLPRGMRLAIVESLARVDVLGFQTRRYARNFLNTCEDNLPRAEIDYNALTLTYQGRTTHVKVYPISVDVDHLRDLAESPAGARYQNKLEARRGPVTIVRVDRLEPSKNLVRGFEAFRLLLERRPDLRGVVKFLAFLVPSRTSIPEYRLYKERTFALIDEINETFGTADWQPIETFYENNYLQALTAMRLADVLLVNPVADGMNLVAKESVVLNERNGVLILSEGAGAHDQLGDYAISVSPGDVSGTSRALEDAIAMPLAERIVRLAAMRRSVEAEDLSWWVDRQLYDLADIAKQSERAPLPLVAS
ncbi:MAG TPA: trehalose-6-phosphate synthase [Chloroflexota bacterium]|nr:trehalose-6-phosphate synthase [Chloroflexota bacterium]